MSNWFIKLGMTAMLIAIMVAAAGAASNSLNATSEDGILVFESPDSQFKWWVDARVYIDVASYFDDGPLYDADSGDYEDYEDLQDTLAGGAIIRRARFAIKSQLWHNWYGEVDMDFAEEGVALKDAYISYRGLFNGQGRVRVGNFRQPFGLEEVTTSRNLMFMERSQGTDPFVVGRRMGLEITQWPGDFRWSASVYGADVEDFEKPANEQVSFAARVNWAPIRTEDSTLLIGAAGTMRNTDFNNGEAKFNTRPESNVSDTKFIYKKVKDVDTYTIFGGELAYVNKRFMAQAEYMATSISRLESLESLSYSGGYIFASYFLTNDTHKYDHKDAEFARVVPGANGGAWEVAVRYSTVDMNDDTLDDPEDDVMDKNNRGGKSSSFTLGVNYYPNPNVKLVLNYGMVDNDEYATGKDEQFTGDYDFSYLQMRFQTAF